MYEELVAIMPVVLILSRALGCGAVTATAMSQPGLRFGMLLAAVALWIGWTLAMYSHDEPPRVCRRLRSL